MKRGRKALNFLLAGILLGAGMRVWGASSSSRDAYQRIPERNVFGLKPPPSGDVQNAPPAVAAPPKITLTGITTILGTKMTFLTVPASKPGAPPEAMTLAEGQAQGGVEVKAIDDRAGVVKVMNHGEEQTLDFEHNGAKPAPPPPAATPPPGSVPTPLQLPPSPRTIPLQNPMRN